MIFVFMVLLLVLIVVQTGVHHTCGGGHESKKNIVDKDDLDGSDDGIQITQKLDLEINWLSWGRWWQYCRINWKSGLKTRLKDSKDFLLFRFFSVVVNHLRHYNQCCQWNRLESNIKWKTLKQLESTNLNSGIDTDILEIERVL